MTIEQQIMSRMKEAMRNKREQELGVLRMVKTQAQTALSAPGFEGKPDDAFWIDIIGKYVKQQTRAQAEFEKAGDAGKDQVESLNYEIEYLSEFLPKKLDDNAVRDLVKGAIEELGVDNPKMAGKVIGFIMKSHKDEVDAVTVKRFIDEELG